MKTKVGAQAFDDPVRRFAVAVPSAVVITALCFALGRCQPADRTLAEHAPAATVVLERAPATPAPPPPTAPPTVKPVPKATFKPVPERAAPRAVHASGGGHAAPVVLRPRPAPPAVVVAGSGGGSGPGDGAGLGPGNAGGSGNGTGGTGSGSVNADAPCGSVDLIPFQAPDHAGSITYEHIVATVTFPDGHQERAEFPYRWPYTDPADDPWSPRNIASTSFFTRVQQPPPGTNTSRFPEVIRYILNHTRGDGTTVLQECPRQR